MSDDGSAIVDGSIVQLHPTLTRNRMFAGCLLVVTERRTWGVQGYVQGLGCDGHPGGQAYYRAIWEEIEPTNGRAPWVIGEELKEGP